MAKKLTQKEIEERISNIDNGEYKLISEFINTRTKVKIKHVCGNIMEIKIDKFLGKRGQRCRCKFDNCKKIPLEEFKNRLYEKHKNDFSIVDESEYVDIKTPIYFKHNKCGEIYKTRPEYVLKCKNCKKCSYSEKDRASNKSIPFVEVISKINSIVGDEYYLREDAESYYSNNKSKLPLIHRKCGKTFWISYNSLQTHNSRCYHCFNHESKGEIKITEYLDKHNIPYKKQYSFKDCIYKKQLKFDFYLEDFNILIEFDGIQHFEPAFGSTLEDAEAKLKLNQIRDNIKNEYCKNKNIPLLRIKYTEFNNIDTILNKFLSSSTTIETTDTKSGRK